jgi:hypothetical protein
VCGTLTFCKGFYNRMELEKKTTIMKARESTHNKGKLFSFTIEV